MSMGWIPLESNPEVLNTFVQKIGVSPGSYAFCDVYGTDPELLMMVPKPVVALLLLFPITDETEKFDEEQKKQLESAKQNPNVWFMKQTIGNACGTIGILHSLANNLDVLKIEKDSTLAKYFAETQNKTPKERAELLEKLHTLASAHQDSANEGQTKPPSRDEDVNLHFIAFVQKDGLIYEMDGRKISPVEHGKTSNETFLEDATKIVKTKFIDRDPKSNNFSMLALAPSQD